MGGRGEVTQCPAECLALNLSAMGSPGGCWHWGHDMTRSRPVREKLTGSPWSRDPGCGLFGSRTRAAWPGAEEGTGRGVLASPEDPRRRGTDSPALGDSF